VFLCRILSLFNILNSKNSKKFKLSIYLNLIGFLNNIFLKKKIIFFKNTNSYKQIKIIENNYSSIYKIKNFYIKYNLFFKYIYKYMYFSNTGNLNLVYKLITTNLYFFYYLKNLKNLPILNTYITILNFITTSNKNISYLLKSQNNTISKKIQYAFFNYRNALTIQNIGYLKCYIHKLKIKINKQVNYLNINGICNLYFNKAIVNSIIKNLYILFKLKQLLYLNINYCIKSINYIHILKKEKRSTSNNKLLVNILIKNNLICILHMINAYRSGKLENFDIFFKLFLLKKNIKIKDFKLNSIFLMSNRIIFALIYYYNLKFKKINELVRYCSIIDFNKINKKLIQFILVYFKNKKYNYIIDREIIKLLYLRKKIIYNLFLQNSIFSYKNIKKLVNFDFNLKLAILVYLQFKHKQNLIIFCNLIKKYMYSNSLTLSLKINNKNILPFIIYNIITEYTIFKKITIRIKELLYYTLNKNTNYLKKSNIKYNIVFIHIFKNIILKLRIYFFFKKILLSNNSLNLKVNVNALLKIIESSNIYFLKNKYTHMAINHLFELYFKGLRSKNSFLILKVNIINLIKYYLLTNLKINKIYIIKLVHTLINNNNYYNSFTNYTINYPQTYNYKLNIDSKNKINNYLLNLEYNKFYYFFKKNNNTESSLKYIRNSLKKSTIDMIFEIHKIKNKIFSIKPYLMDSKVQILYLKKKIKQ